MVHNNHPANLHAIDALHRALCAVDPSYTAGVCIQVTLACSRTDFLESTGLTEYADHRYVHLVRTGYDLDFFVENISLDPVKEFSLLFTRAGER